MSDYTLGKIYKIISAQTDMIYIGSTITKYLCSRLAVHKSHFKRCREGIQDRQTSACKIMCFDDANIVLIEAFPCNSKDELHAREQYWIDLHKGICVNQLKSFVGDDKLAYYAEKNKKNYLANREARIEQVREYAQANKEAIAQRSKQYRQNHSDYIKERKNQRITCTCGNEYNHSNKSAHLRSKKHLAFVESHPEEIKTDVLLNGCTDQRNQE